MPRYISPASSKSGRPRSARAKNPGRSPSTRSAERSVAKQGPAVRKGEIFTATVRDLASDGRGVVAHPSGMTLFVPGVWPGETGSFRVVALQSRVGSAEVLELEQAASARVTPGCAHHGFKAGDCGGCPWQFMDYPAQLAAKQQRLEAALARLGEAPVNPIWPSPRAYDYRNRAQLKTDGRELGYVTAGSHQLAAVEECPILTEPNRQTLRGLRERLPNADWRPHKKAQWTSLNIDESISAETVQVNSRLPFQQSNSAQNQAMRDWLAQRCEPLDKCGPVLELFCGSGNFSEVLSAAGFENIVAVDASGPATELLAARQLPGVSVLSKDLFKAESFPALFRAQTAYATLLLDPPRDGFRELANLLTGRPKPSTIFYVSCDLATLCRDLAVLRELSYRIVEIQPLDQAPHTPHIEVLVHLQL